MSRASPGLNPRTAGTEDGKTTCLCRDTRRTEHKRLSRRWQRHLLRPDETSPCFCRFKLPSPANISWRNHRYKNVNSCCWTELVSPKAWTKAGGCGGAADAAASGCAACTNPHGLSQSWMLILKFKRGAAHLHICDFMPHVIIHHYTKALERETIWENCGCARTLSSPPLKTANFSGFF